MLLAVDVGNTELTLGLFDGEELERSWRLMTSPERTSDEWGVAIRSLFVQAALDPTAVTDAVLDSVVPTATDAVVEGVLLATGVQPIVVDASSPLPVVLDVEEPLTVGADRVVNTIAASRLFGVDTVVVDFGTATTLDCITADGRFLGGAIAPGLRTSSENLVRRTAKLPAVELAPPARAIGRRTEECLRAGVVLGAAGAVDALVKRIKAEWPGGRVPKVVATGGFAPLVAKFSEEIEEVHPDLTLQGLRLAHAHLESLARSAPGGAQPSA